jgi:hypothetical protein
VTVTSRSPRSERGTCLSCPAEVPNNECPKSKRECGHHCNHSWSHDECCWCGEVFGEEELDSASDSA